MPLQETSGAASYDAFGGGVPVVPNYIEDVFSCFLYTGNGTTNTITNNIDLSTKGGLVWMKSRNSGTYHGLYDTVRGTGTGKSLYSNTTEAQGTNSIYQNLTAFNTTGFTLGSTSSTNALNGNGDSYVSWAFRKQPKFFDIVTWTADGTSNRQIPHNLGSAPGFITCKRTDSTGNWRVYHSSQSGKYANLEDPGAFQTDSVGMWASVTSTYFISNYLNGFTGATYVTYLFANDAGGFGLSGTDNVISCGAYTADGSGNATVTLGYEPQWVMIKLKDGSQPWYMLDTTRGMPVSGVDQYLQANATSAEGTSYGFMGPTATGFNVISGNPGNYVYIAIRRGPMAVPTDATKVFAPIARTGTGAVANVTAGFNPDFAISAYRTAGEYMPLVDKLRGPTYWLTWQQGKTDGESSGYSGEWFTAFTNTGVTVGADNSGGKSVNSSGGSIVQYYFQRAPSFMDVVCWTGTATVNRSLTHNLTITPEFIIGKGRTTSAADNSWWVYHKDLPTYNYLTMNTTNATTGSSTSTPFGTTTPTSSLFYVGSNDGNILLNRAGNEYVAHLFATCPGVSKVGSYTGTGTLTTINCGFTGGARYVLIKRTDASANWLMWDTARGMVSGTDPSISSNYQGAEINANSIYTIATGFQLLASPSADVNTNGGSYIYLAIA